jgi:iron complex outermembrane recepter protein
MSGTRARLGAASWIVLAASLASPCVALAQDATKAPDVVVVYGDRSPDAPGAISVIPADLIEEVGANHPAEILNTVPGVNIQMNSGQENLIAIRSPVLPAGAGQGSFLILENGVPIRAPAFGNVNAIFELHHETAEAIEVVRGPGSVRYGSNAVHGLINVIAPEPGSAGPGFEASLSANTLQRYRFDGKARIDGPVAQYAALSITDDNGWRDASGVDMQKLTWRAGASAGDWRITGGLAAVNINQETAGFLQGRDAYKNADIAKTNANPEAYRDAWTARANVRFARSFGDGELTITPFAITQRMIFIQHFLADQSTEKNGHDTLGLISRYQHRASDNLTWTAGADVQWADGYLKEIQSRPTFGSPTTGFPQGLHYDYDVDTLMIAGYGELDWKFATEWSLLAGVRAETHSYDYTTNLAPGLNRRFRVAPSRADTYDLFTPKFGVVYRGLGDAELYANYARGERAPQASDQYRLQRFQTEDTLPVESLDSFEIGLRGAAGPVTYDVVYYTQHKDNFFFRDADGFNVPNGKTDGKGVEAQLSARYDSGLFWRASAAWSDQYYDFTRDVSVVGEDIFRGSQVDTAPQWLADGEFGWRGDRISLSASVEHVGGYFANAANTSYYPGHTIGHLRGSFSFSDALEAFLIVRNVTDVRYADRADFGFGADRYFPGEPVNATLGVRVRR